MASIHMPDSDGCITPTASDGRLIRIRSVTVKTDDIGWMTIIRVLNSRCILPFEVLETAFGTSAVDVVGIATVGDLK